MTSTTSAKRRLTTAEIISYLEDEHDNFLDASIFIEPPDNPQQSDCDSDNDDPEGDFNHLSGNQLLGKAEFEGRKLVDGSVEHVTINEPVLDPVDEKVQEGDFSGTQKLATTAVPQETNKTTRYSKRLRHTARSYDEVQVSGDQGGSGDTAPHVSSATTSTSALTTNETAATSAVGHKRRNEEESATLQKKGYKKKKDNSSKPRKWMEMDIPEKDLRSAADKPDWYSEDKDPVDIFELFFDTEVVSLIRKETVRYAVSKGQENFSLSENELKIFLAILFISGYNTQRRRRMYWESAIDVNHTGISRAMGRNRFEEILRYFHVADNAKIDAKSDRFAKVRPLWNLLNSKWLEFFPDEPCLSVDESMCPYFGRHPCKQHIHGKPIRFGYKIWCLCTRLGYLIQGIPYQGAATGNTIPELGVGGSVVMSLVESLPDTYSLYFDNFFTSFKLLEYLQTKNHEGTGTVRSTRVENAPLKDSTVMKKLPRGSFHQVTDKNSKITLVRYNDNNVVTVASSCCGVQPLSKSNRWSNAAGKRMAIDRPRCVEQYNMFMGGVDRLDQNIAAYRIGIRSKKWYWPLIDYVFNVSMNNAWQIYRLTERGEEENFDLLEFTRSVVQTYLAKYAIERQRPARMSKSSKSRVDNRVRLSRAVLHSLVTCETQKRCGECGKNARKICSVCQVGCHIHCFEAFHT